jgi:hypothetical protein
MNKIEKIYIAYPFKKSEKSFLDIIDAEIDLKACLRCAEWQILCLETFFSDFTIIKDGPYFF